MLARACACLRPANGGTGKAKHRLGGILASSIASCAYRLELAEGDVLAVAVGVENAEARDLVVLDHTPSRRPRDAVDGWTHDDAAQQLARRYGPRHGRAEDGEALLDAPSLRRRVGRVGRVGNERRGGARNREPARAGHAKSGTGDWHHVSRRAHGGGFLGEFISLSQQGSATHKLDGALVNVRSGELRQLLEPCIIHRLKVGPLLQGEHQLGHASQVFAALQLMLKSRSTCVLHPSFDLTQLLGAVPHDRLAVAGARNEDGVFGGHTGERRCVSPTFCARRAALLSASRESSVCRSSGRVGVYNTCVKDDRTYLWRLQKTTLQKNLNLETTHARNNCNYGKTSGFSYWGSTIHGPKSSDVTIAAAASIAHASLAGAARLRLLVVDVLLR